MADEASAQASSDPLPQGEGARFLTAEDKASRKRRYYTERDATKIYLFDQHTRWRELMSELELKTDKELAAVLLDQYMSRKNQLFSDAEAQTESELGELATIEEPQQVFTTTPSRIHSPALTSTPDVGRQAACGFSTPKRRRLSVDHVPQPSPAISRISNVSSRLERTISASESEDSDDDSECMEEENLLTSSMFQVDDLERASLESEVYDVDVEGHDDIGEDTSEQVSSSTNTEDSKVEVIQPADVAKTEYCIVATYTLMKLLYRVHGEMCKRSGCDQPLEFQETFRGTCLVVVWKCHAGHFGGRWASQPTCAGLRAGNLLLASAIALSGNSYTKIGFLFKVMNMTYISKMLFNQYQNLYIAPTVEEYWREMKEEEWKERDGKDVILSSDGRNDSPGHCAQYLTYSFADMESKTILNLNIVDVREVEGRKSTNMERLGFERGLDELLTSTMSIQELVTDGHLGISALMKNSAKYKEIVHQWDVWHGGKNLGKKVIAASKEKGNEELVPWVNSIRNHFWYCSRECDRNVDDFKHLWAGILHHIINEHTWVLSDGKGEGKCGHGVLTEEERQKPWLTKNSSPQTSLRQIVLNKRFLNTFPYYARFRHTGFLESFHNHLLMYCPKRHSYSFVGYKLRNLLAAIDYNKHRVRKPATNAVGEQSMRLHYSKRTKVWRPVNILEPKEYAYIPELLCRIFRKRVDVPGPVTQRLVRSADDPRNIAPNIAATPRPTLQEALANYQSRF